MIFSKRKWGIQTSGNQEISEFLTRDSAAETTAKERAS